jgi:hypothetical protein
MGKNLPSEVLLFIFTVMGLLETGLQNAKRMRPLMMPRNAKDRVIWLALLLLCILLSSCSSVLERAYDMRSASVLCLPSFPDKDGWYGGDGAYSIKLDDKRVLWLFGDTFVSMRREAKEMQRAPKKICRMMQ